MTMYTAESTCSLPDCTEPVKSNGMCLVHYKAAWYQRHRSELVTGRKPTGRPHKTVFEACAVEDCERVATSRGWCKMHHKRWLKTGDPLGMRPDGVRTTPIEVRFWKKVDVRGPDDCMLWTGTLTSGYGMFKTSEGSKGAHVVVWEWANGPVPEGHEVCHNCEDRYPPGDQTSRRCVNLAHLRTDTHQENIADMVRLGRQATGERNVTKLHPECILKGEQRPNAKLKDAQVVEIRRRFDEFEADIPELASTYEVNKGTIYLIVHRRTWKHLP